MEVGDLLLAVLAPDVGRDVLHGARPVEGNHGGEVVDPGRPELADVARHARRLPLEDAGRLARGQEGERRRVVERNLFQVDLDPRCSRIRSTAARRIVRLERPRKSNLRSPSASIPCISYWVIVASELVAFWSGISSARGSRLMTTPAAWVEALRATPSSCLAKSMIRRTDGPVVHLLELGAEMQRLVEPDPELVRTALAIRSTSP